MKKIEVKHFLVFMDPQSENPTLWLSDTPADQDSENPKYISIAIGLNDAEAISRAAHNDISEMLLHEVFYKTLKLLGTVIEKVVIDDLSREGQYSSTIYFKNSDKEFQLLSNPSAAFAVALRFGAKVYITDEVFKNFGVLYDKAISEELLTKDYYHA